MINLDTLERLARTATSGPYDVRRHFYEDRETLAVHCRGRMIADALLPIDAVYLEALDPSTILKLVAVARAAQKACDQNFSSKGGVFAEIRYALEALNAE